MLRRGSASNTDNSFNIILRTFRSDVISREGKPCQLNKYNHSVEVWLRNVDTVRSHRKFESPRNVVRTSDPIQHCLRLLSLTVLLLTRQRVSSCGVLRRYVVCLGYLLRCSGLPWRCTTPSTTTYIKPLTYSH